MVRHSLFIGILLLTISCSKTSHFVQSDDISFEKPNKMAMHACRSWSNYQPDSTTPVRQVRVNFHVMRDSNGLGNFQEKEAETYLKELLDIANDRLANNQKMNLPVGNETPVLPIKYQYKLTPNSDDPNDNGIYFHNDQKNFFYLTKGKHRNFTSKAVYDKYATRKGEVLNIFVMPHHPDSVKSSTYKISATGIAFPNQNWVKIAGLYHSQFDTMGYDKKGMAITKGAWFCVGILNHEIGHILSLPHTWGGGGGCPDTPRNPNCWAYNKKAPCDTQYSNNMMDYNTYQNALSPCQLGKIHSRFSQKNTAQRKMLEPTWCSLKENATVYIGDEVTWEGAKDLEGNLVVEDGATLTIKCRVSIPKNGKIIVEPEGKLILDGAELENDCQLTWAGIEIETKGKKKGSVVFKNIPTIRNVKNDLDYEALIKKKEAEGL